MRSNGNFCLEEAKRSLLQQSVAAVEAQSHEIFEDVLQSLKTTALAEHKKFRCKGVWEAVLGAFVWTLVLIAFAFILAYAGIDIAEISGRVLGRHK